MDLTGYALLSLSSLFAVVDPLGCIPFFSGQTAGMSRKRKRRILWRALLVSLFVLLAFTYAGSTLLHTFGITIDAFRIAGGVSPTAEVLDTENVIGTEAGAPLPAITSSAS